jgi:phage FluMu gp28-like protein
LYPYQRKWLQDQALFKVAMLSRQTGKTFTTTLEIALDLMEAEATGIPTTWIILSRGERQAREAFLQVKKHLSMFQVALKILDFDFDTTTKGLELSMPSGSRVIALPANPDTARGYTGNVFLDEFAIHRESRAIWTALVPIVSAGYKLRVTSTPRGRANKFYELMTDAGNGFSKHVVTILDAIAQGLPRDAEVLRKALGDEEMWQQEFMCEFLSDALNWLSFDLINSCEDDDAGNPALYAGGPCYGGEDIARRNDLFVISVFERIGDVQWLREQIIRQRISFAEQDALRRKVFERYDIQRYVMDQTGMGEKPVEDAKRAHGSSRVHGVLFTAASKQEMATTAKQLFEDRKLRITLGDYKLRADLHSLKKITGPSGIPRFQSDGDTDGHADRAWSMFLALSGISQRRDYSHLHAPRERDAYESSYVGR